MKVRVIKTFRDKHTKGIYKVGQELTINKKRFDEILTKGKFVEEIPTNKKEK